MGSEWSFVSLSELTTTPVTYGVVQPGQNVLDGVPLIRVNNFQDNVLNLREVLRISRDIDAKYQRTRVQHGDVLVTIVGSVGQVAIVPPALDGWNIARAVAMIRPKSLDMSRWISLVLRSPVAQHQLGMAANTTVQTTINLKDLRLLQVPMPGKPIRDGICEILGALDDRIDNLRQTNATLEAIAQALFKSWFVNFEPVRAKTEDREPEGMDVATAALFPYALVDSELGSIPEGWKVAQIGELVDCLGGGTPSTRNEGFWEGGEHHWATPKDLSGLSAPVLSSTARKATDAGIARISSGLLPAGTLLMSSRAPIGYLAIAAMPTAINQGFIAIPPGGALPPAYLLFWAKANMDLIKQKANGSTFMEISKRAFRPIQVLLPPPEVLAAFMAVVSPILDRIKTNEGHGAELAELRDTLLPRLISGKLRLPEAERAIDAATA
ncbi:restriction endonuclease subunit S [Lysobacter sp. A289]